MALFTAIAGAIGAISTWTIGSFAAGAFLLQTAAGTGLNLLAQAIAGKPKDPTFSINGTIQAGGDIPRSFILGRTATAGSLVWVNTWGDSGDTPNAHLTQVIALSDLPVASLDEVWVNGEKVTLADTPHATRGYPVLEYRKGGKDYLWVKFYDGTQTTADAWLTGNPSTNNRQWQWTRVGRGVAYAIVTAKITKNLFSGIPNFKFVLSGLPLYDPSKDSTVPGGSGSHRWDNPATWGGDGDHLPVVQIYNLLRGIQHNGQWFYGLQGMTGARLPTVNWIAQINKCRAGDDGPTYRSAGEIPVEAPLANAIEAILTACQGRLSEIGGVYNIFVGEPDAPLATFTDDDIISTEEQSFTPFFGLADTINGIAATYPSPEDGWAEKAAPPLYRTDLEALAGNRRLMADVSLDFVPYPAQVQRLMKSALAEGQRARRHTLVLPPAFWPYAVPGAILSWTSARNGYVNKQFRVDGAVDRANLDVMIDITEVDPADFDWDSETDYKVPVDGALGPIVPAPQPLVGWQVFPASYGESGKELPSIRVAYPGNLDDVRAVRVQVRLAGEVDPFFDGEVPYGDPDTNPNPASVILSGTFAPDTDHQARGILVPEGDREPEWSEWLSVKTPNVWIATDLSLIGEDMYRTLKRMRADLDKTRDDLRMLAMGADEVAGRVVDERHVAVRFRDAAAVALSTLTAAISDDEGNLIAVAEALTAVQAAVGDVSADGLRKIEVQAGTGDVVARLVDMVRATIGDDWVEAGTVVEVGFEGGNPALPFSKYYIFADQFGIINPADSSRIPMFAIVSGQPVMDKAFIRGLATENIQPLGIETAALAHNSVSIPHITNVMGQSSQTGQFLLFTLNGPQVDMQQAVGFGIGYIECTLLVTTPAGGAAVAISASAVDTSSIVANLSQREIQIPGNETDLTVKINTSFVFVASQDDDYTFRADVAVARLVNTQQVTAEVTGGRIALFYVVR